MYMTIQPTWLPINWFVSLYIRTIPVTFAYRCFIIQLVHIGTNNADKEGTTAIVDKYSKLLKKTKEARVEQIILSGILPVFGNRIDGYRNSKRMAINGMVKRLCKEEDVGYVDLWDSFVGKEEMYLRDGLHISGKGAAVFAEGLSGAVASGLGKVRYLN